MARNISERKLNRLLELNKKLGLENDFSKRIELISNSIKDILNVDRCTIFLHDSNSKSMWSVYIDGVSYIEVPDDKGIVGEVYRTKKTIVSNNMKSDPNYNNLIEEASGYITKSILSVPIIGYDDKILGVIQLINKTDGSSGFNEEDEKVLGYVMNHISAYLEVMMQEK